MTKVITHIGQTLVAINNHYGAARLPVDVVVTKIGRRWAEVALVENRRVYGGVDIETLRPRPVNDFTPPIRYYLSREALAEETAVAKMWRDLRFHLTGTPPPGLTAADIERAQAILMGKETKTK